MKMENQPTTQANPAGMFTVTQPQPAAQTTVIYVGQQPTINRGLTSGYAQDVTSWSTGLCGCCEDMGICCTAWWCFCIHDCILASKMNECMCGPLCFNDLFRVPMRTKVRHMYGIQGSIFCDICTLACCPLCAVTQMHRELKNRRYI